MTVKTLGETLSELDKDYPIVRAGLKWRFGGRTFWLKRNAKKYRVDFIIFNYVPDNYARNYNRR